MLNNMQNKDIKTMGYVLKRTNYAEADRILNLITPQGKISAIAKGVRKEKSKLAGGIEMFTLSNYNIHLGRGEFGVITSAKMQKYHGNIIKNFTKMELAAMMLKKLSRAAENSDNSEYFEIINQCLASLDMGDDDELTESWFLMRLGKAAGEEINLYRDADGEKLNPELRYFWNTGENSFVLHDNGDFGVNEIKMLRLLLTADLSVVKRVKVTPEMLQKIVGFTKMASRV